MLTFEVVNARGNFIERTTPAIQADKFGKAGDPPCVSTVLTVPDSSILVCTTTRAVVGASDERASSAGCQHSVLIRVACAATTGWMCSRPRYSGTSVGSRSVAVSSVTSDTESSMSLWPGSEQTLASRAAHEIARLPISAARLGAHGQRFRRHMLSTEHTRPAQCTRFQAAPMTASHVAIFRLRFHFGLPAESREEPE
jgi:hypothetical protein